MQHYDVAAWHPWLILAACGAVIILAGVVLQATQLVVSIRQREILRDRSGDPWNGRTLEWSTASPPPSFNFAVLPRVEGLDAYWLNKQQRLQGEGGDGEPRYEAIEMPCNSPTGFVCAVFASVGGFALIWHIWWMAAAAGFGAFVTFVIFAWRDRADEVVGAEDVARAGRANRRAHELALAAPPGPQ